MATTFHNICKIATITSKKNRINSIQISILVIRDDLYPGFCISVQEFQQYRIPGPCYPGKRKVTVRAENIDKLHSLVRSEFPTESDSIIEFLPQIKIKLDECNKALLN